MTRREQDVVDAAVTWFLDRRPRNMTPAVHLECPALHRGTDGVDLAVAVANLLKWRKRVAELQTRRARVGEMLKQRKRPVTP